MSAVIRALHGQAVTEKCVPMALALGHRDTLLLAWPIFALHALFAFALAHTDQLEAGNDDQPGGLPALAGLQVLQMLCAGSHAGVSSLPSISLKLQDLEDHISDEYVAQDMLYFQAAVGPGTRAAAAQRTMGKDLESSSSGSPVFRVCGF